jgi:hypothetical protein
VKSLRTALVDLVLRADHHPHFAITIVVAVHVEADRFYRVFRLAILIEVRTVLRLDQFTSLGSDAHAPRLTDLVIALDTRDCGVG